jgi:hypothetical protein
MSVPMLTRKKGVSSQCNLTSSTSFLFPLRKISFFLEKLKSFSLRNELRRDKLNPPINSLYNLSRATNFVNSILLHSQPDQKQQTREEIPEMGRMM